MPDFSKKNINVAFLDKQSSIWTGGINYFRNLFIALSKTQNPQIVPYILNPEDEEAKCLLKYAKPISVKPKKDLKYLIAKIHAKIQHKKFNKLEYILKNHKIKAISHTSQKYFDFPLIAWITDFQHKHLPEMFSADELEKRDEHYNYLAENSNIVILSSEDAKKDFIKFFPQFADKARVLNFVAIPEANLYEKTDKLKEEIIKKFDLPEKYFYVPNQFWKHKNHKIVLEAISILKKQGIEIKVVFSGNTNDYRHLYFYKELTDYISENSLENNVKILKLIEFIEIQYLMRNCISLINPSLFEGWSTTVEEAKSIGKNIILSNINVHFEQNPPEARYFDPKNADELAEILKEKWFSGTAESDYELEKQAKENLENRIIEFRNSYTKIILDIIDKKE